MNFLKKYWGWGLVLFVAFYAVNLHIENNKKRVDEKRAAELKSDEFENRIFSIIKDSGANYQWIKNFDKKDIFAGLHTIDLQNEWIKNGPIFFVGTIEDLSEKNSKEYLVTVKYSGFKPFLTNSVLHLNLTCDKNIIDSLIQSNKKIISNLGTHSIAIIAKVDSIESSKINVQSSSEKSGLEIKDLKVGVAQCIRIEPTDKMFPNFKFMKN